MLFRSSEDEAKDIVQETFIRVWLHLDRYKNQTRFTTWLYKIACNLCYDRLRAIKRFRGDAKTSIDLSELEVPGGNNIEQSVINRDLKELIITLTHGLTPKQQLVFTLRDIEGLELEDVSEITGMSGAKIKSNLYLARQYIRNKINES